MAEPNDQIVLYLVTAKHCIEHRTAGLADGIELFLNRRSGGTAMVASDPSHWMLHPSADVAVVPVLPDVATYDYRCFPVADIANADFVQDRKIGAGDDVFITGLLVHHPGVSRFMPIVRVGNVAAMPPDPINLATGADVVALIEARSIGGLSGSPVFVHLPFWRDAPPGMTMQSGPTGIVAGSGGHHRLLGVMHGFFPVGANDPDGISQGHEDLNTGIAVVVLVDRVMDFINHPDQIAARDALKAKYEAQQIPTSAATEVDGVDEFQRFEALTRQLINTPKPKDR